MASTAAALGLRGSQSPSPYPLPPSSPTLRFQLFTAEYQVNKWIEGYHQDLYDQRLEEAKELGLAHEAAKKAELTASPGNESRRFKARSDKNHHDFARGLYEAIRNDHFMKGCSCGPPAIYSSREEAESGAGHLRFYVNGRERKNLRALQRKDDRHWHCACGKDQVKPPYQRLINSNGKRPAEDSELDLIAQNSDDSRSNSRSISVSRLVPAPSPTPTKTEEEEDQDQNQDLAHPMWSYVSGMGSRVANMGNSVFTLLGKILGLAPQNNNYDVVDNRSYDAANDNVISKRLKRQSCRPLANSSPQQMSADIAQLPYWTWTDDATKWVGQDELTKMMAVFTDQLHLMDFGDLCYGPSIDALVALNLPEPVHLLSIAIHMLIEDKHGPYPVGVSANEMRPKFEEARNFYQEGLHHSLIFMTEIYSAESLDEFKTKYPDPPSRFCTGTYEWRHGGRQVAEFLGCLIKDPVKSHYGITGNFLQAISKVLMDVNAVHKQEMLLSYVEYPGKSNADGLIPGAFPTGIDEDVAMADFEIQPVYALKHPSLETPSQNVPPFRPAEFNVLSQLPKGVLKKEPKQRDTKRKIAFESPVAKFVPPTRIPAKVLTVQESLDLEYKRTRKEILNGPYKETLAKLYPDQALLVPLPESDSEDDKDLAAEVPIERDNARMGLERHANKYNGLLEGMHQDILERQKLEDRWEQKDKEHKEIVDILKSRAAIKREHAAFTRSIRDGYREHQESRLRKRREREEPTPKPQPRHVDLAISSKKQEDLEIRHQLLDEVEAQIRRDEQERRQREIEEELRRKAEEERKRAEEERRKQEAERKRLEEKRRREEAEKRQQEAAQYAALTGLRAPSKPIITPITEEWNAQVTRAANANPSAELAKTPEGQELTRRDFEEKLLPKTAWLNDNVIIGSIQHIAEYVNKTAGVSNQEPKCAAFTSFFWNRLQSAGPSQCGRLMRRTGVRKANFFNIDTILIPICAQSHWTLAVVRPGQRTVSHIDSMQGGAGDKNVKRTLLNWVQVTLEDLFVKDDWKAVDYQAPHQTNGYDCGVFTITNAICMALGVDPKLSYSSQQLTQQRRRLAAILLNGGFTGEFSLDGI
ncbi:hypothetical protein B0T17DRAFT_484813 [Bombardia bombarda]|uniref:Ubiquitin-like protease family profile domain-containing protein n=1 Tax=Bombardia bombarda TaxID=252184 RepID=A0AA39XK61_9PEZI|nr:hypothetical protein B0T17DRAFT_484813 [Bombardia bombarda]